MGEGCAVTPLPKKAPAAAEAPGGDQCSGTLTVGNAVEGRAKLVTSAATAGDDACDGEECNRAGGRHCGGLEDERDPIAFA